MVDELVGWLSASTDGNEVRAALLALPYAPMSDAQRARVVSAVDRAVRSTAGLDALFVGSAVFELIVKQDLVRAVEGALWSVVQSGDPTTIAAACVLLPVLEPRPAREASHAAAQRDFEYGNLEGVDKDVLTELVALDPRAWSDAVCRHAERGGALTLHLVTPILEVLPLKDRRETATRLRGLVNAAVLPWCTPLFGPSYRPVDLVNQVLFDCGEL
jgi:hypothetical protein